MSTVFDSFCASCRESLLADRGETGREEVCRHLESLLAHPEFIDDLLGADVSPGRHIIHHDPETDMYVLAHVFEEPGRGAPHDHGPFWVAYGNAAAYTDMTEWRRVDDGSREGAAELEVTKEYRLEAGMAKMFDVGAIHSISYPANARFIRVTSGDAESGKNLRFNVEAKTVEVQDRGSEDRIASRRTG